ncbi:phosphatidyl synthase-like protein [Cucurbitaria berberidis CBS 394.84]|uniref:Phosphatidyl synthase-like protein n=1 Tax=Cucurbitaria berberidis CBS 394.84 TaxID=1168544 RepID=A0A9P4LED0_9PLEO|nr:phosphatidyl synthase-like protein [Cucurbitaria berberidis CBS 394.84]KAF1850984.1 phosphatidyl synthase-like protein [Cucurbitaria berberidis CBS 394.84]
MSLLSMAGVRAPSASLLSLSGPSIRLRALSRHPRIGQTFCPLSSRASYSWFRNDGYRPFQPSLGPRPRKPSSIQPASLFSTSTARRLKVEEDKNGATQTSRPNTEQQPPTPATTNLATTLKSKLKLDTVRHENIYNIPNILTLSRLIATPAIGYLIIHNHHLYAFSLFVYAAFSDLLDGWIARRWNLQTVVGSVVDPMADKLLMTTLVTCLAVNGSLPMPLFVLIFGRDVSLAIAALYYRYASLPAPKTLARYWDFSLPSAEVHPTTISKLNTFLQLSLLGTLLCTNLLHDPSATSSAAGGLLMSIQDILGGEGGVKTMIQGMSAIVASTTVYSGLEYTWSKKAVVILGGDEALKRKQGFRGRMIMASGFGSFIALAVYLWYKGQAKKEVEKEAEQKK